jgi:hypothetical protein
MFTLVQDGYYGIERVRCPGSKGVPVMQRKELQIGTGELRWPFTPHMQPPPASQASKTAGAAVR